MHDGNSRCLFTIQIIFGFYGQPTPSQFTCSIITRFASAILLPDMVYYNFAIGYDFRISLLWLVNIFQFSFPNKTDQNRAARKSDFIVRLRRTGKQCFTPTFRAAKPTFRFSPATATATFRHSHSAFSFRSSSFASRTTPPARVAAAIPFATNRRRNRPIFHPRQ